MTEPDWMEAYQQRRKQERREARQTLSKACTALQEQGVSEVRIEYDGYGDSGAVEGVTASGPDGEVEISDPLCQELSEAVERLLPSGWENNSGAFGEFVLDVAKRRLTREHHWRVESTEYDEEKWNL